MRLDFDALALPLLVHLSYCVPLLTIQMLVFFQNFIKYKSLGSLSHRGITPLAIFFTSLLHLMVECAVDNAIATFFRFSYFICSFGDLLSGNDATGNVINIHSCMEGLEQHGNATFIPDLEFVLPVLEAGGSKSDKKQLTNLYEQWNKKHPGQIKSSVE